MSRIRCAISLGMALWMAPAMLKAASWQPPAGHAQLPIWPGDAPDATTLASPESASLTSGTDVVAGKPYLWVENVTKPSVTVYSPSRKNSGVAVIVFPGGGYKGLAIDLEGTEICDTLVAHGITCVVLKYRVPDSGPHHDDACNCRKDAVAPTALEDAQRAVGLVRLHAAEWHVDPHRIGVMGFSAGGHMVANLSTHWDQRLYPAVDSADALSCRPDFAVAVYPGHLREKTTGDLDLNPTLPISAKTPPTFLLQAVTDPVDDVDNSLVYFIALKKAGVPVEMHLFGSGGHAFGVRQTAEPITRWPRLLESWLVTIGMLKP